MSKLFSAGSLTIIDKAVLSTGGSVSNTGLSLLKLGNRVELMTKISDDMFGGIIKALLKQHTNNLSGINTIKSESSSYTIVMAIPGVDRFFFHNPGTNNTFGCNDINFNTVKKARVLHLGYPTLLRKLYLNNGSELVKIFKKAKSLGTVTSLDITMPDPSEEAGKLNWNNIFKKLMPYTDIFLPSIEEALYTLNKKRYYEIKKAAGSKDPVDFFTLKDLTRVADTLLDYGVKIAVIKCGHRGYYLKTAGKAIIEKLPVKIKNWAKKEIWTPCFHVEKAASATGAGDASIAGFLTAFVKGESAITAVKCATAAGAQNVTKMDALSGIKDWKTTIKMAQSKKLKIKYFKINDKKWIFNKKDRIWIKV
ncbi:MAG: hypothetical protein A2452_04885 [Candidatus Firestonebacteria bacterium RIFOXYC2_FULL_39_67]|nr:MAG: hypothetical protein A2536_11420 [Candidatus Firestonebacteria bacterium RIFOXYD2_FULL_39_29]OGF55811.1 MAG: hypothetical protein A2452_04885 [Candidatus Firestonebacteria bacterium RIFOXYC2_FULL_39_67]